MKDFFMTLHSDQATFKGMNNATGCFKVHLGHELFLPGKWEVGLAEIFYPMTINILSAQDSTICIENILIKDEKKTKATIICTGDSRGMVCLDNDVFFLTIKHLFNNTEIDVWMEGNKRLMVSADADSKKVHLSDKMKLIMGMNEKSFVLSPVVCGYKGLNVKRALPQQLLVATDLIHNQLVGGTYDQVLRCVPIDHATYEHGCSGHVMYENIHYYPLAQERVDDIQFYIRKRNGRCVSFESGTLTVILHFRALYDD